jgi:sugar lactone lactonase YvrE
MFKQIIAATLVIGTGLAQADPAPLWETEGFFGPESALYDAKRGLIFVSNVNGQPNEKDGKGSLSLLSPSGKMLNAEWQNGLNAPKGLAMVGDLLYVADIDTLRVFNIMNGKQVASHVAPVAKFLNDVAVDKDGNIYVSDFLDDAIYRLADGEFSVWVRDEALQEPNGLHVEEGRLVVGAWGEMTDGFATEVPGHLKTVDLKTRAVASLGNGKSVGNLDGVEPDGNGSYFVSDWYNGGLFRIDASGNADKLLTLEQGSADIGVIPAKNIVLVPMMKNGTVRAYQIK